MKLTKLISIISLTVAVLTMITSTQLSIHASPTTEDDGWTEDEADNDEEVEDMYDGSQWEFEDGNDEEESTDKLTSNDDDDDDGDDEEQIFSCSDGSTVSGDEECPSTGPNPYCDTDKGKAASVCHDRKDADEDTGLYPCNDGTEKKRWQDCKDATKKDNDNKPKVIEKTTVIHNPSASASASVTATAVTTEESSCRLDGSADGIVQKFDLIKYQACGLYTNGQIAYADGFVVGCTQIGNTQLICQSLVDSSVLNMKTQSTQTITEPTQTQSQPTQSQAIQPATTGG